MGNTCRSLYLFSPPLSSFSIISRLAGHTRLLFISDGSHANNEACEEVFIHPHCCSQSGIEIPNIQPILKLAAAAGGWAVAEGGDGTAWDEMKETQKGRKRRKSEGKKEEEGRGLMMQEGCRGKKNKL